MFALIIYYCRRLARFFGSGGQGWLWILDLNQVDFPTGLSRQASPVWFVLPLLLVLAVGFSQNPADSYPLTGQDLLGLHPLCVDRNAQLVLQTFAVSLLRPTSSLESPSARCCYKETWSPPMSHVRYIEDVEVLGLQAWSYTESTCKRWLHSKGPNDPNGSKKGFTATSLQVHCQRPPFAAVAVYLALLLFEPIKLLGGTKQHLLRLFP